MAAQTEGANIVEIAFSAAFDHGYDVIRIPEAFARPAPQSPMREE